MSSLRLPACSTTPKQKTRLPVRLWRRARNSWAGFRFYLPSLPVPEDTHVQAQQHPQQQHAALWQQLVIDGKPTPVFPRWQWHAWEVVGEFEISELRSSPPAKSAEKVQDLFQIGQLYDHFQSNLIHMTMRELTQKQLSSVPCPTCGASVGERCILHSGGPRSAPHVDRKLSAAEALSRKKR
jgi:hypothetical protein